MPGRRTLTSLDPGLCRRCQDDAPAVPVRGGEPLCRACFARHVSSKVVKRMEGFRVRHTTPGQSRKLLLPVVLPDAAGDEGLVCALALLHVLSLHLRGQRGKTGRTGYELCVAWVEGFDGEGSTDASGAVGQDSHSNCTLEQLAACYPEHAYHRLALPDALAIDGIASLLDLDASALGEGRTPLAALEDFLRTLPSATARIDLRNLLRRKLLRHAAAQHACEAILDPSSATALASQILAETAKGRGFALPWLVVSDSSSTGTSTGGAVPPVPSSSNGIPFVHLLQDLLHDEITAFAFHATPAALWHFHATPSHDVAAKRSTVSTKHSTIDALIAQYFAGVAREYPSVVANVVKTAGKLRAPSDTLRAIVSRCELCEMPLDLEGVAPPRSRVCYGCVRTLPHASAG